MGASNALFGRAVSVCLGLVPLLVAFGCAQLLGADFDAKRRPERDAGVDAREDASLANDAGADASQDAQATDGLARDDGASDGPEPDVSLEGGPDDGGDGGDGSVETGPPEGDGGDAGAAPVAGLHFHHPIFFALDPTVRGYILDLSARGVHFSIPWRSGFYTTDDSCKELGCPTRTCGAGVKCPECQVGDVCYWRPASVGDCFMAGYHELECWVRGALDLFRGERALPPVSVLATLLVHSGEIGDWRVGPRHIAALQSEPGDMSDARVLAAYRAFYDEILRILRDVYYRDSVRDWTLSVGNHVNTYLCDAPEREAFHDFYEQALVYAREPSRLPTQPLRLGTSAMYHAFHCPGVWDINAEQESAAAPWLRALNAQSDVLLLEYFAAASPGSRTLAALDPNQATHDVERMFAFRDSVRPGGQRLPLLLADVGYPTHPDLHDVDAAYGERFSRFGDAYSSGDAAQQLFAASVFNALMGRRDFAGLYWWALSDLPDWTLSPCRDYVFDEFGGDPFPEFGGDDRLLKGLFCTSGLIAPPASPIRNAATVFGMWANIFTR